MTHEDVLQVCDADMRTKVYSVVPGFKGKGDRMTVQDAINYEMADRFDTKELRYDFTAEHDCHTSPEDGCDICEKYAHEAWMAQA